MENEVKEPAPKFKYVSLEQYLEMEKVSPEKIEYYKGEVFAMSGASIEHNVLIKIMNTHVLPFLKDKPFDMSGSNLRVYVSENSFYTYPGFSIICNKPESAADDKDSVINPSVIIEVLSKSTMD